MKKFFLINFIFLACINFSFAQGDFDNIGQNFKPTIIITPNPVNSLNKFTIRSFETDQSIKTVEITNIVGKKVYSYQNTEDNVIINTLEITVNWESGVYLAKITFSNKIDIIKKVLVN